MATKNGREVTSCCHNVPAMGDIVVQNGCSGSNMPQFRNICENCYLKQGTNSGRMSIEEIAATDEWPHYES